MGRLVAAGARTQKMRNENANALLALRMHLGCTACGKGVVQQTHIKGRRVRTVFYTVHCPCEG